MRNSPIITVILVLVRSYIFWVCLVFVDVWLSLSGTQLSKRYWLPLCYFTLGRWHAISVFESLSLKLLSWEQLPMVLWRGSVRARGTQPDELVNQINKIEEAESCTTLQTGPFILWYQQCHQPFKTFIVDRKTLLNIDCRIKSHLFLFFFFPICFCWTFSDCP